MPGPPAGHPRLILCTRIRGKDNHCRLLRAGGRDGQSGRGIGWRLTIMKRHLFAAALLAGFCATPVLAQETKVGDWTIEKRSQDTHCNASRSYKDPNDQDR